AALMLHQWIGESVRDLQRDSLVREARALAAALTLAQPSDVAAWVAHLDASARVTVIARDGRVLGDPEVPAPALASLEHHATRPILAMTRAARAMTHGDFDATLPPPGDDELGELVHALDTLRNQLAMRLAELRQEGVKLRAIVNGMSEGVALVQDATITVANP